MRGEPNYVTEALSEMRRDDKRKCKLLSASGYDFTKSSVVCEECHFVYDATLNACPGCGRPNEGEKPKKKKKHKGLLITLISLALVVATLLGLGAAWKLNTAREEEYYKSVNEVYNELFPMWIEAGEAISLFYSVWYHAAYNIEDAETDKYTMKDGQFVDDGLRAWQLYNCIAIENLKSDPDYQERIDKISSARSSVTKKMSELKTPPRKYKELYSLLKAFYEDVLNYSSLVIYPPMNITLFGNQTVEYGDKAMESAKQLAEYMENDN